METTSAQSVLYPILFRTSDGKRLFWVLFFERTGPRISIIVQRSWVLVNAQTGQVPFRPPQATADSKTHKCRDRFKRRSGTVRSCLLEAR